MAELADALGSGPSDRKVVEVQVLSSAFAIEQGLAVQDRESLLLLSGAPRDLSTLRADANRAISDRRLAVL